MKTEKINFGFEIEIHDLELIGLRIGYINDCQYTIDLRYNELKNFGESDLKLALVSVWNEVLPYFSDKERALLLLTDYIICSNYSDGLGSEYDMLLSYFDYDGLEALAQAIIQIDLWTRSMRYVDKSRCPRKNQKNENVVI